MFDRRFPEHWTTNRKLIWLIGAVAQGASAIWKTVTGTLIHITDALAAPMRKCEVSLEPIQDLHGQDAPYPAGGSANIFDEEWEIGYIDGNTGQNTSNNNSLRSKNYNACSPETSYYAYAYIGGSKFIYWYDSSKNFLSRGGAWNSVVTSPQNASYFRIALYDYGTVYHNDISINYPSSVTSYSPYSNICPITGWTGCNIKQANKNLMILDTPYKIGTVSYGQNVGTKYSPGITTEGTYSFVNDIATFHNSTAWRGVAIASEPLKTGTYRLTYKIDSRTGSGSSDAYDLIVLDKNYVILRKIEHRSGVPIGTFSYTITINEDGCFVVLDIGGRSSTYVTVEISNIQLEVGTVSTEYQRPNTTTYPISWQTEAWTVYGGTLDVVNGTLTVTDAEIASYNGETLPSTWISDRDVYAVGTTPTIGAQVVYKLATPVTYHLASVAQISTLAGENNIWADVNGEITLTYKSDGRDSNKADTGKADFMKLLS